MLRNPLSSLPNIEFGWMIDLYPLPYNTDIRLYLKYGTLDFLKH